MEAAAAGTSLLIIAMNSFAGYLGKTEMQWGFMMLFAALQKTFAVFVVVMAVFILYENRGVFL